MTAKSVNYLSEQQFQRVISVLFFIAHTLRKGKGFMVKGKSVCKFICDFKDCKRILRIQMKYISIIMSLFFSESTEKVISSLTIRLKELLEVAHLMV